MVNLHTPLEVIPQLWNDYDWNAIYFDDQAFSSAVDSLTKRLRDDRWKPNFDKRGHFESFLEGMVGLEAWVNVAPEEKRRRHPFERYSKSNLDDFVDQGFGNMDLAQIAALSRNDVLMMVEAQTSEPGMGYQQHLMWHSLYEGLVRTVRKFVEPRKEDPDRGWLMLKDGSLELPKIPSSALPLETSRNYVKEIRQGTLRDVIDLTSEGEPVFRVAYRAAPHLSLVFLGAMKAMEIIADKGELSGAGRQYAKSTAINSLWNSGLLSTGYGMRAYERIKPVPERPR